MNYTGSGQIEGIRSLKDGSVKVEFVTQELSPEDAAKIFGLRNQYAKCLFSTSNISSAMAEALENFRISKPGKAKTPAQRLRAALYVAWEQDPEGHEEADSYYESKMELFINHVKKQLD